MRHVVTVSSRREAVGTARDGQVLLAVILRLTLFLELSDYLNREY